MMFRWDVMNIEAERNTNEATKKEKMLLGM